MKVHTAEFADSKGIAIFGAGRYGSFRDGVGEWRGVTATVQQNGIQFSREKRQGAEFILEVVNVPWAQVKRWSPAPTRRPVQVPAEEPPATADGARKK